MKEIAENVNISDEEHEDYSSDDLINNPNYSPSLNADKENDQQFFQDLELKKTTENIENDEILECEFYEFSDVQWNAYEGRHKCFDFIGKSGLQYINLIVTETTNEFMNANLKKREMIAREDKNGILVLNWLDT